MELMIRDEEGAARRAVDSLRPYPASMRVYRDHASPALVGSVRATGVLEPLLVTTDSQILDGRKRWEAACELGLEDVPVRVFTSADDDDRVEAMIAANRDRTKSNDQRGREALILDSLTTRRETKRDHNEWLGRCMGISSFNAGRLIRVMHAIDRLERDQREDQANELRATLNRTTINTAFEKAKEKGYITVGARGRPISNPDRAPDRASERWRARERRAEQDSAYHRGSLLGRSPEYMRTSMYVQRRMRDLGKLVQDIADERGFDEMVNGWSPATRLSTHGAITDLIALLGRYDAITTAPRGLVARAGTGRRVRSRDKRASDALAAIEAARASGVPHDNSTEGE